MTAPAHSKISSNGDSFLYFFVEEGYDSDETIFFKIGIVSHALTDDQVQSWKKYVASPYPVSIARRIHKLNNGNPRQIKPLAYFRFSPDLVETGVKKSQRVETAWKRALRIHAEQTPSSEWFRISKTQLGNIIAQIVEGEQDNYTEYWWHTNVNK
jgi:hypothetical protein